MNKLESIDNTVLEHVTGGIVEGGCVQPPPWEPKFPPGGKFPKQLPRKHPPPWWPKQTLCERLGLDCTTRPK